MDRKAGSDEAEKSEYDRIIELLDHNNLRNAKYTMPGWATNQEQYPPNDCAKAIDYFLRVPLSWLVKYETKKKSKDELMQGEWYDFIAPIRAFQDVADVLHAEFEKSPIDKEEALIWINILFQSWEIFQRRVGGYLQSRKVQKKGGDGRSKIKSEEAIPTRDVIIDKANDVLNSGRKYQKKIDFLNAIWKKLPQKHKRTTERINQILKEEKMIPSFPMQ